MTPLAPGDLCVIVHPGYVPDSTDMVTLFIGRTVVLVAVDEFISQIGPLAPYWRVSGLPLAKAFVSHAVLRKIPPESMLDARTHADESPGPTVTVHPAGEDVVFG